MKRRNSQLGSLHVIIIVVLFVALMATLGVVFYQNFVTKKPDTSEQDKKPVVVTPAEATTRVAFSSDIYELDHLDSWKSNTMKIASSTMGASITKVVNSKRTIQVTFTVSEESPVTACDGNDGLKISSYHVGATVSNKLVGIPLYLVEALSDNLGGGYQYKIGLTPDGGDTHAALGQTHCNVMHVGTASTALLEDQKLVRPTITATIDFPKLPVAPKPASKDMQTIKDLMNTADYKEAVKILESARKE